MVSSKNNTQEPRLSGHTINDKSDQLPSLSNLLIDTKTAKSNLDRNIDREHATMSTRKSAVGSTARSTIERRGSAINTESSSGGRNASPARVLSSQGTARSSVTKDPSYVARPNRASVQIRRPSSVVGSIGNIDDIEKEENARIENAALVENLKKSLKTADLIAEENRTQLSILQKRYDDLFKEHGALEDRLGDTTQKLGELETKRKEDSKSVRDMANLYESERMSMLRDREESSQREEELRRSVQRLKETMAGREMRFNIASDPDRRSSRSGKTNMRCLLLANDLQQLVVDQMKDQHQSTKWHNLLHPPRYRKEVHQCKGATPRIHPAWSCRKT